MRLLERTLCEIWIAPVVEISGALGGVKKAFSDERTLARGSLQPVTNTLNHAANALNYDPQGMRAAQTMRILLAKDVQIEVGDGICFVDDVEPKWQCVAIESWTAHKAVRIERRA